MHASVKLLVFCTDNIEDETEMTQTVTQTHSSD